MKRRYDYFKDALRQNKEDIEYLLFVGIPGGILIIILSLLFMDYSKLF
jgi:hypothetical protein